MKTILLLIGFLALSFVNFAQTGNRRISGNVVNTNGEPLVAATVSLYRSGIGTDNKKIAAVTDGKNIIDTATKENGSDPSTKQNVSDPSGKKNITDTSATKTLLLQTITDANGQFSFNITTDGTYALIITMTGYEKYISKIISIDQRSGSKAFGTHVPAKADAANLQQVTVTAKKPLMEQQVDRMVINVEAMIGAPSNNALEILEKTPGVTVDMSGTIGLNGKSGVMVMIDGRPTQMSANDLAAYLKSIPGGTLDKIELIDNPPARYDAGGSAIINIRLKKNRLQGFNGNLSTGISQGIYTQSNNSVVVNFNRKKFSFVSSIGYSYNSYYSLNRGTRNFLDENELVIASLSNRGSSKSFGNSVNGRVALDYAASDNTSVGLIFNTNPRSTQEKQNNLNTQLGESGIIDSSSIGETGSRNRWLGNSYNLNFVHRFKKPGREISADANYMDYRNKGSQQLWNQVMDNDGKLAITERFSYLLPSDMNIYTLQADYMHPLPKKARIDAGIKAGQVDNDNEFMMAGDQPGTGTPVNDRSNRFIYREDITAMYVSGRKEWKRISMQAGLRVENTQMDGNQLGNSSVAGSKFKKNYTNAFPSFFASYKADTSNINFLDLSYARRIRRPNYQSLNPFEYFVDQYSLTSGNPDLNPQFVHQVELKYRYKKYLGIGLQYNYHTDVIFQVTEAVDKVFINRPRNVAKGQIIAVVTNVSIPVAKWWNINFNVNVAHLHLQGEAYNQVIDQETFSIRGNMNQQFTLGKGFSAEMFALYNGRDINGQRYIDPRFRINAGVLKKIMKGKATIRLSVDDIFYSWRTNEESRSLQNAIAYNLNVWDSRRGAIGFTWSFGKESSKKKRTLNENSAQEEKGRVD